MVVLNDSSSGSARVSLSVPGAGRATVEPLRGDGMTRSGGVTFAGMAIAAQTGRLTGRPTVAELGGTGHFSVSLPPASADLISFTD